MNFEPLAHAAGLGSRLAMACKVAAFASLVGIAGCSGPTGEFVATSSTQPAPTSAGAGAELSRVASKFYAASTPGNSAYKIGPQDVLEITVFKVPDLSKTVQVADNGFINYPLIGEVSTAGKTAQDVEHDLTRQLGARYLQLPQVTVFVKEYNSQRVTVEGAVKRPGVYPLRGKASLIQVVAQSEGLDREVASSTAVIFRQGPSGREAAKFDLDEIRAGHAEDPQVIQGDTIVVETSAAKVGFSYIAKLFPAASLFKPL